MNLDGYEKALRFLPLDRLKVERDTILHYSQVDNELIVLNEEKLKLCEYETLRESRAQEDSRIEGLRI